MSKAEKAGEPSMDEILASIRKIIAEDPVASRKPRDAGHGHPMGDATMNGTAAAVGSVSSRKSALDDVLGLADFGSEASDQHPPAPDLRQSAGGDRHSSLDWPPPSWPATAADAAPKLEAERARGPAPAALDAPKPFFPAPTAFPMPASAHAARSTSSPVAPAPVASATERPVTLAPTTPKAIDIGAIIPQRLQDHAPDASSTAGGDRRGQPGRLPDWLSRPTASTARSAPDAPADKAKSAPREPIPSTLSLSELAAARTMVVTPLASTAGDGAEAKDKSDAHTANAGAPASKPTADLPLNGHDHPEPAKSSPTRVEPAVTAKATETGLEPPKAASAIASPEIPPVAAAPAEAASTPATMETVDAVADAAAAPSFSVSSDDIADVPAETVVAPLPAAAAAVAEPVKVPANSAMTAVPKPSLLGERTRAAKVQAGSDLVPTVGTTSLGQMASGQPGGLRTLEDTVVELLRPMLRQWLDDNMPRMVEKALRIELAQSIKPNGDASKH